MTLNPDIVIKNGTAIADVKYKLAAQEWNRNDLYQVVTFATGYRTGQAALISFNTHGVGALPPLKIGDVYIRHIAWRADDQLSAPDAEFHLIAEFTDWIH